MRFNSLHILVPSCDAYSDLWRFSEYFFYKYWPDCCFNVSLITNYKHSRDCRYNIVQVGEDKSWSTNLKAALKVIYEPYVLLILDDLILKERVENKKIMDIINWAVYRNINYIRLCPRQYLGKNYNSNGIGTIPKNALYRASTVGCLWKKEVLEDILRDGESAWEFEKYGSIRSNQYEDFYITKDVAMPLLNGVIRGKWNPEFLDFLDREDIQITVNTRKNMDFADLIGLRFITLRSKFFSKMPMFFQIFIKKLIFKNY